MKIPLMDLKRQYETLKPDMDRAIQSVLESCEFIGGREKSLFERNFAVACGVQHCVGVGNGTDAIYIALKAMGIGPGDEVVVPTMTFIATAEAVTVTGATPVFVDSDPHTCLMDLTKLRQLLEKRAHGRGGRVRALIPVHLYGRIHPMTQVMDLANEFDLKVLEDCAQAHLAEWKGVKAGAHGHMATFSFYPGKNLGAYGDAGAIITNDAQLAETSRKLANHGRTKKYDHDREGFNSRLDGIQAAVLNVKLPRLSMWTERRRECARVYNELLADLEGHLQLPQIPEGKQHVFHLYVIRVKERDRILKGLESCGVQAGVHYPIALHNLQAYAHMGHKPADFPVANQLQNEVLSLPLFPEITREEQKYVTDSLRKLF